MKHHLMFAMALVSAFTALGSVAFARPNVELKLSGAVVAKGANGNPSAIPFTPQTALRPGETVRFNIVATNVGSDPALHLAPIGKIPAGTAYEAGSASSAPSLVVEFSLDGGKSWSKTPMQRVTTPSGVVEKKADPASYTAIRWITATPLKPSASVTYSYEVRVK